MECENSLLRYIIMSLHGSGLGPMETNLFSVLRGIWTTVSYLMLMVGLVLELFLNFQGLSTITRAIGLLPILLTIPSKMHLLVVHKNNIKMMILKTKHNLKDFYPNTIKAIGDANMNQVYKVFKINMVMGCLTSSQMLVQALFGRIPIVLTYKEQDMSDIYWSLVFCLDVNFLISATLFYQGYNWLFLFLTAHVVSEMKMLNAAISQMDYDSDSEDFRVLVDHHKFVLSLVNDINHLYDMMLLMEYMLNFLSICFCLFCMTMDGIPPSGDKLLGYGLLAITLIGSMLLFSYAGDSITSQCDKVATNMFHAIMKKPLNKKAKFSSFMVIGRSHKQSRISIGGFWDLNMETFYLAMRKCLSFLMFIQALRERGHNPDGQRSISF